MCPTFSAISRDQSQVIRLAQLASNLYVTSPAPLAPILIITIIIRSHITPHICISLHVFCNVCVAQWLLFQGTTLKAKAEVRTDTRRALCRHLDKNQEDRTVKSAELSMQDVVTGGFECEFQGAHMCESDVGETI